MLTGFAHSAVCVPDVEEAVQWYTAVLGLRLLSPPYTMEGSRIQEDMGELLPSPVVVKAAIVGFGPDDRVIELIESHGPRHPARRRSSVRSRTSASRTSGLVCENLTSTHAELEGRGVAFLTSGIATSPDSARRGAAIPGAP